MPQFKYWNGSAWVNSTLGLRGIQGVATSTQGTIGTIGTQGTRGAQGVRGSQGAIGAPSGIFGSQGPAGSINTFGYNFSTTTTDADPGSGFVRFNNIATSATQIYISDFNSAGTNIAAWIQAWDNSTTSGTRGYIHFLTPSASLVYRISAASGDLTNYFRLNVTRVSGTVTPANNQFLSVTFIRSGNPGTTGAQGTQGPSGTQNTVGAQGPVGTANTTIGTIGAQGPNGVQGFSAIPPSSLTTKGDLLTYSTALDVLPIGTSGNTLLSDPSATDGISWNSDFSAGRNKIINGDFRINQRAFTSNTALNSFNFDRWFQQNELVTHTVTPQNFTLGSAPVSGYEGSTFVRCVTSGGASAGTFATLAQKIESVRTLAGQTATLSFWAKAGSGTPKIFTELNPSFGTGGSPSSEVNVSGGQVTLSTSWARYSVTFTIPSIAGKTVGTNNNHNLWLNFWFTAGSTFATRTGSLGLQNNTFDIWGVQLEAGSVATPFTTATGNPQAELAACQRYYFRFGPTQNRFGPGTFMAAATPQLSEVYVKFPVTMRAAPTALEQSGTASHYAIISVNVGNACSAVPTFVSATRDGAVMQFTQSGSWTTGNALTAFFNNSAAYLGWSAEL